MEQIPGARPTAVPQEAALRRARLAALRRSYQRSGLDVGDLAPDPVSQFHRWFDDAVRDGLTEPNAMVLATATPDGTPSARTVLLKGVDDDGFVLFTNRDSLKGAQMRVNPVASLVFPWFEMDRQVVVSGRVGEVSRAEAAEYFRSRPRDSQLGAWASPQSTVVADRAVLEEEYADARRRWPEGTEVPLPDHWGGFRVVPDSVEFWQGRVARMHDRLRYRRTGDSWTVERLAP